MAQNVRYVELRLLWDRQPRIERSPIPGLMAGGLAGLIRQGNGFGIIGDIVVGILGICLAAGSG